MNAFTRVRERRVGHVVVVVVLAALVTAPSASARAEPPVEEYRFVFDPALGGVMGATDVLSGSRLISRGVDELAPVWERRLPRWAGPFVRAIEFVALDWPFAYEVDTVSHEIFGHGNRARELGLATSYTILPPAPYGFEASSTIWKGRIPLPDEQALLKLGGHEVEAFGHREIAFTAFRADTLSRGDALTYWGDSTLGLLLIDPDFFQTSDIDSWLRLLHRRYGGNAHAERAATIASAIVTAGLDPLLLYSVYATFVRYVGRGQRAGPYPEISFGGVRASFTTGLAFIPWGREHQFDLLLGTRRMNLDVELRVGEGPGGGSVGLSIDAADVFVGRYLRLSAGLDYFGQPGLAVKLPPDVDPKPTRATPPPGRIAGCGGRAGADLVVDRWFVGLRPGFKTRGLLLMRPYADAFEGQLVAGVRLPAAAR